MTARLLDGRALAQRIEASLAEEVRAFATMVGRPPRLVVVLVGDMGASASYVKSKAAAAARVGIDSEVIPMPATAGTADLVALVQAIARDEHGPADGILVQLPLPPHVDSVAVLDAVPPDRDVDGFHPENAGLLSQGRPRFIPCTAAGVQRMLIDAGIEMAGRHAVIIGLSFIAMLIIGLNPSLIRR
ncbi:MAG: tetrahydrofolate dehydrogenase/cyclohydrolase catalytic domain-containing protein [Planctomycetia bacterium]